MQLNLNDTFNTQLPADKNTSNTRRQVTEACFSYVTPRVPSNPKLLHFSDELLTDLGLSHTDIQSETFLKIQIRLPCVMAGTNLAIGQDN